MSGPVAPRPRPSPWLAILPLVAWVAMEAVWGVQPAIAVAMVLAVGEVAWTRHSTGRWSGLSVGTAALVVGLGGLSLLSGDERFARWTPALGDGALAAALAGAQWLRPGWLVRTVQAQDPTLDVHPLQARFLHGMGWRLAANLALHGALVVWSVDQGGGTWAFVTGPVQYALLGAQVAAEVAWARWVVLPRVEALEAAGPGPAVPEHAGGDPADHGPGGHVAGDHRAHADDGVIAHDHAVGEPGAGADPHVVPDPDAP